MFPAGRFGAQTCELAEEVFLVIHAQAGTFILHFHADADRNVSALPYCMAAA